LMSEMKLDVNFSTGDWTLHWAKRANEDHRRHAGRETAPGRDTRADRSWTGFTKRDLVV
jgi:hypothetical protein